MSTAIMAGMVSRLTALGATVSAKITPTLFALPTSTVCRSYSSLAPIFSLSPFYQRQPHRPNNNSPHLLLSSSTPATTVVTIQTRSRSNRSRRGLYNGKDVRTGNNVPFSLKKTKRKYHPNVFIKRVYSEILDEMIPFHITASALRSIDKAGGLDQYLLTSKHVVEGEGLKAKKRIRHKMWEAKVNGEEILGKVAWKSSSADVVAGNDMSSDAIKEEPMAEERISN